MGELILCNQMLAALPYYIDDASLNIYSLEELSYYVENNVFFLQADFMDENLCTWIETELQLTELADKLREIYRRDGKPAEFIECILMESGYLKREKIQQIVLELKDIEYRSAFDNIKLKADRYAENKRYTKAVSEYRKLIGHKEKVDSDRMGSVWHNLGCAYAGLFFFREAAECFANGYELNHNPKTRRECLYAYCCMHDKQGFEEAADKFGLSKEEIWDIRKQFTAAGSGEEIEQFKQRLDEVFSADRKQELTAILAEWKDTYRKNCKI